MLHSNSYKNGQFATQNATQNENKKHKDLKADKSKINKIAPQKSRIIKFSDVTIRHLKPKSKRMDYWCQGLSGFGIRISPKGTKTWIYYYRIESMKRRLSIGQYPAVTLREAKVLYQEAKKKVDRGIDPLLERQEQKQKSFDELTLSELIALYLEHCKKAKKKSYNTERKCLEKDIIPVLGKRKITTIQAKDLSQIFHTIIVEREAPSTATHLYSYVRRLFNFASDMGLMRRRDNPCLDIKLNVKKKKRSRHLSPQEIYQFWHTIETVPMMPVTRLGLKFMLVTVARGCEVRLMKWSDINWTDRIWTLPMTKNGHLHRVYLSDLAINILNNVKPYSKEKGIVFGSHGHRDREQNSSDPLKPMSDHTLSQPIKRHWDKFGIETPFTPHDLRRTGATLIAGLFGRRDLTKLCLNHVDNSITAVYDQYAYSKEKEMAINALNKAIEIIINSKDVESVPSFDQLREQVFKKPNHLTVDTKQDFQASFSDRVSYKLSFDLKG